MLQNLKLILLKDSVKQVGAYTITGSLCKAISFAALPFFVNTLSEGDIGILNIFSNSIVFLTPIVSMGVLYTISIDYFKLPKHEYAKVFSTGLIIPLALSFLLIPLLYLFRLPLERLFNFQPSFFWLIPFSLLLNFCFEAFMILMRNQNNVRLFTIVSILKILLEIGLSIGLILLLYRSWYSRAMGVICAGIAVAIVFVYYIRKNGFWVKRISTKILRSELAFGLSGLILQTAVFFIGTSDKFFVMSFFGKEQAGYYAVASTFAAVQYIICTSLLQYLQPVLFREFAANKGWQSMKGLYFKYSLAMLATLVLVTGFSFIVYNFVLRPSYKAYLYYFYILAISSFIWTITNIFLQFIVFNKNKRIIFQLSVSTIFISILVNYTCSKFVGINWLLFGQVVTNCIVLVIVLLFNKKIKLFSR